MLRPRALITGASSGLGEEFAFQLARQGHELVLVARSRDRLCALADRLRSEFAIDVDIFDVDLARAGGVNALLEHLVDHRLSVDLLVNNAGFGIFENFLEQPSQLSLEQIRVNFEAPVALTRGLLPQLIQRHGSGVINLCSNAAFQPLAGANIYAASKAALLFFSEALAYEVASTGTTITAVCPGPVATRFFDKMNPSVSPDQMDQPGPVVRAILDGFRRKKRVVYPGRFSIRATTWWARVMPRDLIVRMAAKTVSKLNRR